MSTTGGRSASAAPQSHLQSLSSKRRRSLIERTKVPSEGTNQLDDGSIPDFGTGPIPLPE